MMKSFIIATKDLKIRLKDRKAILMMLLMPVLLTAILGAALKGVMGNSSEGAPKATIGLYQQDENSISKQFVSKVLKDDKIKKTITIKKARSEKQLQKWVDDENVEVGMILPKQWDVNIKSNVESPVKILPVSGKDIEASFIQQLTESYADTVRTIALSTSTIISDLSVQPVMTHSNATMSFSSTELVGNLESMTANSQELITDIPIGKKSVSSIQYYAAAMAAMFLLFNAMHGGKAILNEKSTETLSRMLTSPTNKRTLLIGKFLGTLLFAIIQFLVFMNATHYFLHVNWGDNLLQVCVIAVVYSVAVSGLSMIVAAFCKSEKTADTVGGIGVQIFALLGGSMLPISVFPSLLKKVSLITPNSWALSSFTSIMSGTTWETLVTPLCIMLLIGIASLCIGTWKLRTI